MIVSKNYIYWKSFDASTVTNTKHLLLTLTSLFSKLTILILFLFAFC